LGEVFEYILHKIEVNKYKLFSDPTNILKCWQILPRKGRPPIAGGRYREVKSNWRRRLGIEIGKR